MSDVLAGGCVFAFGFLAISYWFVEWAGQFRVAGLCSLLESWLLLSWFFLLASGQGLFWCKVSSVLLPLIVVLRVGALLCFCELASCSVSFLIFYFGSGGLRV